MGKPWIVVIIFHCKDIDDAQGEINTFQNGVLTAFCGNTKKIDVPNAMCLHHLVEGVTRHLNQRGLAITFLNFLVDSGNMTGIVRIEKTAQYSWIGDIQKFFCTRFWCNASIDADAPSCFRKLSE